MEKINYSVSVRIANGPSIAIAGVVEVDAYEKLALTVPAKKSGVDGTATATISPGDLAHTKLLLMTASSEDGTLSFKTSDPGAANVPIRGPVTLIGGTACSLLESDPDTFTFTNTAATEASVMILVGRKAVG